MKNMRLVLTGVGALCELAGICLIILWAVSGPAPGKLDVKILHKPTLMTVAYKTYGNPAAADGKYWLAKLILHNDSSSPVHHVQVSFQIPDYIGWTTPDTQPEILPGQTAVLAYYPKLPAKVSDTRTRTPAELQIKITYNDGDKQVEEIQKRPFEFRGVTEIEYTSLPESEITSWYDVFDNSELLAAFVTDEDPVVKAYFGKISETMGGAPYVSSTEDLLKAMKAIYDFQVGTGLVYMGAKGVPEQIGDVSAMVQSIKLPRQVIEGNSGTCIELSIMWASLLPQIGVKTYLVMIPGHCFILAQGPGGGPIIPFECTGVGGKNLGGTMDFKQALESGAKTFKKLSDGQIPGVIVDVADYQAHGIRPPELDKPDNAAIAKMLADRVNAHRQPATPDQTQVVQNNTQQTQPQQPVAALPAGFTQWSDPTNTLTVPYPQQWQVNPQMIQQIRQVAPWYAFAAVDPNTMNTVEVYIFPTNNPAACTQAMSQFAQQMGMSFQFGQPHQGTLGGKPSIVVPIAFASANGQGVGELHMVTIGNVTYVVSVDAMSQMAQQATPTLQSIIAHTKVGAP